jgi:hypothetical protein
MSSLLESLIKVSVAAVLAGAMASSTHADSLPGLPSPPPLPSAPPPPGSIGGSILTVHNLKVARLGHRLVVTMIVTDSSARPISEGSATCDARLSGKPLRVVAKYLESGVVSCTFGLPAARSKAKVSGTIGATQPSGTISRSFAATPGT